MSWCTPIAAIYNIPGRPQCAGWYKHYRKPKGSIETHASCSFTVQHFMKHSVKYSKRNYNTLRYDIVMSPLCSGWFQYCDTPQGALETHSACFWYNMLLKIYLRMQTSVAHFQIWYYFLLHPIIFILILQILQISQVFVACLDYPNAATCAYFYYMWSTLWINLIATFDYMSRIVKQGVGEACGDKNRVHHGALKSSPFMEGNKLSMSNQTF